jgi:hypothetical protein
MMELRDQDGTLLLSVGKTGGPAFPAHHYDLADEEQGMTLRDYFAAQAMPLALAEYRMVTNSTKSAMGADWGTPYGLSSIANKAYEMADAMLKARAT